jgi:hypothetical protein
MKFLLPFASGPLLNKLLDWLVDSLAKLLDYLVYPGCLFKTFNSSG